MKIKKLTLHEIQIPLRFHFSHAQASYRTSQNFVVQCETEDGTIGWGEGVARSFVTGESDGDVFQNFSRLSDRLWKTEFKSVQEGLDFLKAKRYLASEKEGFQASPAVSGGVEMAVLDAWGQMRGKSVAALLGGPSKILPYPVPVSGVLGLGWNAKKKWAL